METNAQANDRGQAEVRLTNAIKVRDLPPVNVHVYSFEHGEHVFKAGKGAALLLGFVQADQEIVVRDAGVGVEEQNVDWLFY